ncbi:hypothetical protein RB653_008495 [Dictyostelium firmibasis]|uniref:Transmembrane protein n=1 Tax=Dictyostelium firmibasis TaxID=79012 RepID=A0AAN7TR57_9MYCE
MKLKIGIALSVLVLVCCIVSFALPWYQILKKEGKVSKEVVVNYEWKKFSCQIDGNDKTTLNYDDDDVLDSDYIAIKACVALAGVSPFSVDNISKILNSSLSFLVIAAALALGTALLQLILLLSPKLCRSCIWKLLCIGCSIATIVMLFISFFTFLGAPKAFENDTPTILQATCDDRWCNKIIGSDDYYRWIPGGGWWACLSGCFLSLVSGLFTLASHR